MSIVQRNQIYYLFDLHCKCNLIIKYGDDIINKYIEFVKLKLDQCFTKKEQIQLKLNDFNYNLLSKIADCNLPENISFDNIDDIKLFNFFDKVSYNYDIKYY